MEQAEGSLSAGSRLGRFMALGGGGGGDKRKGGGSDEGQLAKVCRDACKMAAEQVKGLSSQVIKGILFNIDPARPLPPALAERTASAAAATTAIAANGGSGAPVPMDT